jgi:RNA polymerase sigma-70 factor, ECF subfamily
LSEEVAGARDPLSPAFLSAWRGAAPRGLDGGDPHTPAPSALEQALAAMYEEGRLAFPHVPLAAPDLAAYAGARARDDLAAPDAVRGLRAGDLFLACACARGARGALDAFDRALLARIPAYLRRLRPPPEIAEDTRRVLLDKLFVAAPGRPPKILQYSGRGALEGWVRVAALRAAVNLLEARSPGGIAGDGDAALERAVGPGDDPELLFLKARYRAPFVAALREAIAALPARDRALLQFAYVEGLTPERIGKVYGVHRTTAMRWIDAARAGVLSGTRARLTEALGLTPSECDGVLALVQSRLDVTLGSLLLGGA